MKKIFYSFLALFGFLSFTACDDMLMTENDSMVIGPELDGRTDSVFYALGIAQGMQQLADQYFYVGEMRGELVAPTVQTDNNLRQLSDYSQTESNRYDSAYVYYKVINNCNYYLANRDTALYVGSTNVSINEYAAVAAWRAWAYLQLARSYGGNERKIPFYTEPLTAISQIKEENFEKKNLHEIVEALAPSLEEFSGLAVPTFGTTEYYIGTPNWSEGGKNINPARIFVPVDVILGEMYLEDGQWLKAAQYYCKYLCNNKLLSSNLQAGFRTWNNGMLLTDAFPEDFGFTYNNVVRGYNDIFQNTPSPTDVLTYIPMAVSSQRGQTTTIPLSFGYDYYSTQSADRCPRVEDIQIVPSKAYYALTDTCDFYYYPNSYNGSSLKSAPDTVHVSKMGDARANYSNGSDNSILNRDVTDTTKVYILKAENANVYLYRTSTVYLHLAEALNRLGHPDIAFAILRNGISTYLEELVPDEEAGTVEPYQYMTQESIELLQTEVPFLNIEYRNVFLPEVTYGIHNHGGGTLNATGMEIRNSVNGSRATAVGSQRNHSYLPEPIIGAKMKEIAETFGVEVGTTQADYINAMEDILCDEYAKEFAFEGVRFYDLQRMARHKNEAGLYGANFGSRWFAEKLKGNNPAVSLLEAKNWYLPFN